MSYSINSLKWNQVNEETLEPYPLWIAEHDFGIPPFINKKLIQCLKTEDLGYFQANDSYRESIQWWYKERFSRFIEPKSIIPIESVLLGINVCLNSLFEKNDEIVVFDPEYHQIIEIVQKSEQKLKVVPLYIKNKKFHIRWDRLETALQNSNCRGIIFSNPHNPGGQCWTLSEVQRLSTLCQKYDILIISDEIHSDLTYNINKFNSMTNNANSIVLNSISKAFNLAGLKSAYMLINDPQNIQKVKKYIDKMYLGHINKLGLTVVNIAYTAEGLHYLAQVSKYFENNYNLLETKFSDSKINILLCQASYLPVLTFNQLKYSSSEIVSKMLTPPIPFRVNDGLEYGLELKHAIRISVGTDSETIKRVIKKLSQIEKKEI